MATLASATDELITRNAVCAAHDNPMNSLGRGGSCGQTLGKQTVILRLGHRSKGSSTILRQARPYTHTRSVAFSSSSKLDKGEQTIYDKLSEHFQPTELLIQTSVVRHSAPTLTVLVDLMVAKGLVDHSMLLPLRCERGT